MRGIKQGTKGEDRKMSVKQYLFCEIKFILHLASFLRLLFQTTRSCDWKGFRMYCFPSVWGNSDCQRTGVKEIFLQGSSNLEKEIQTRVSACRAPALAQRSCCRTEVEGTGAKVQHKGMADVFHPVPAAKHPVPAAEFSAPAHWAVTAHMESPETWYRSAATLTFSSLFFSYLQQSWRMKLGNTHVGTSLLRSKLWKHSIYQV